MDLPVLKSHEFENHILSGWSVCVCCVHLLMCVCYQINSKTFCSRNSIFYILNLYHASMLLETLYEYRIRSKTRN